MQKEPFTQSGTLTSAALVILPLELGRKYHLLVGKEGDNFNTQTVTPKLFGGANTGLQAEGTLTVAVQPTDGDTMTIGSKVFTFRDSGNYGKDDDDVAAILIGADLTATQANIVDDINGTGDSNNKPHPDVTAAAFVANASVITAIDNGSAGNLIATTSTFTSGSNLFDAATLGTTTAGTDVVTGDVSALPTAGDTDSDGSPLVFAAHGQVGFDAGQPHLVLVPSGAVTSVKYALTLLSS